jgi:short-subunit dehydrogenase
VLKNKIMLLTGASEGIGRATAVALARAGATVVLTARSEAKLREVASEIESNGGTAIIIPADLGTEAERARLVDATRAAVGRIDVLINNAGLGMENLVGTISLQDARHLFEVNFFAPLDLIQRFLPEMRDRNAGQIVNVSSIVGHRATPNQSIYCASKYALNGLSDALRTELVNTKILVTDIYPGVTATNFPVNQLHSTRTGSRRRAVSPERVAEVIVQSIQKRQRARYVRWQDQLLVYGSRVLPRLAEAVIGRTVNRLRKY